MRHKTSLAIVRILYYNITDGARLIRSVREGIMTVKQKISAFFTPERSRKIGRAAGVAVAVIAAVTVIALSVYAAVAYAPLRVNVDLNDEKQTLGGFGASSAWIYQELGKEGNEQEAAQAIEMLYGDSGLQLNIFRYNIGGGSKDSVLDDKVPYSNEWFDPDRRAESFFVAENYSEPSDFLDVNNYDFSRDAAVQNLFEQALEKGNITKVVFFANSPHYLMTESGLCTGAVEYQNNLKPEFYDEFSEYLLICVNGLDEKYGLTEKGIEIWISPANEPQWKWGGPDASQEGCHYDPEVLAAFYDVFWDSLQSFNADNDVQYRLDAFESGSYELTLLKDDIRDYLEAMSKYDYFDELGEISAHAYHADDSKSIRSAFADFMDKNYPELEVVSSEFCEMQSGEFDTIESGMYLAKVVLRDLTMIDATEWSWWLSVAAGTYNDGLVYWNTERDPKVWVLKRYYTMGQFSRFLDPGDVRVNSPISDLTGWAGVDVGVFVKPDGRVVVLVVNDGSAKDLTLNGMDKFVGSTVQVTTTTQDENWKESDFVFDGTLALEEDSVTTFVFGAQ